MSKKRTIDSFYKRSPEVQVEPEKIATFNSNEVKLDSLIRDPGKTPASAHNFSVRCYEDLKNKVSHIENVIDKQTEQEIMDNRLRLKVTIDSTTWLTLQTCPLRGDDERPTSINRGNYLELVKLIASYNKDVARVVETAPQNAKDVIQSRHKKDDVTIEHHYRVDVIVAIDSQLQELNNRFNESVSELLLLSVTLDPRKSFNADDICKLVTKYYPLDFTEQERIEFRLELQHYELDNDPRLKNISSLSELCRGLQITEKSEMYPLIDRLVRLILTLPVSTATSERAFSKMKLVKTRLRSTMSDDFLKSSMILSIEREIVGTLCTEKMIDDFYSKSQRRVQMMKKRKVSS
ncbi:hypothetical protein CTI12_AA430160 [Artemisia annua]|uniref:HAT C-terminal dimerisation domain-containing protein n=1 Tax=Artemisia annua TaxID=35608 RepID=A0A2U1M113_ARTAN|nr:hypothetical protein CTI12_AA430160 [Artemisia annua]